MAELTLPELKLPKPTILDPAVEVTVNQVRMLPFIPNPAFLDSCSLKVDSPFVGALKQSFSPANGLQAQVHGKFPAPAREDAAPRVGLREP